MPGQVHMTDGRIDRRRFLQRVSRYALAAPLLAGTWSISGCSRCTPHVRQNKPSPKLILQNGNVFTDSRFQKRDLEIRDGRIAAMAGQVPADTDENTTVVDCTGLYISPGWVDLHCHMGAGIGIKPCLLGPQMGVTALAEAGTYGPETVEAFLDEYAAQAPIPVYLFLNVRKNGIQASNILFRSVPGVEDVEGAQRLAARYPDIIRGFKVRLDDTNTTSENPAFLAEVTAKLASDLSLPVMYHLGKPEPSIADFLKLSKPGDIITHFLRETDNAVVLPDSTIRPEAVAAREKGVRFDVGHGFASFRFATAQTALENGFTDFTISSDLWLMPSFSKALTFANVASKFLALGLPLEDVTRKISTRPREILQIPSEIQENREIDLTVFEVTEGSFEYEDTGGNKLSYDRRILPCYTIMDGELIPAGERDRDLFA